MAQAYDFERDGTIETLLPGTINHALTTAADFFLDFVIAKVSKQFYSPRSTIIPWRWVDCLAIFANEQIETSF
jgi:hypothetical protein